VLLEVVDALSGPAVRAQAAAFLRRLRRDEGTRIEPLSSEVFNAAVRLFEQRPDKSWSLTDCTSFVIMQGESLSDALTGDQHFEQASFRATMRTDATFPEPSA
jgi:uncharacterized protein